jgi:Chaperone of endosialidase
MNKQIAIIMLILGIIFSGLAAADTTRSCKAQYVVSVRSIDDAEGITYPSFSGQGTMDYYAPNSARRKAYVNLQECIQAFDNRDREVSYCSEANQIYSYPFAYGLIPQITNDLCSRYPGQDNIVIDLHVLFQGDEGCVPGRNQWNWPAVTNYRINCLYNRASDIRLKTNITPVDIGLQEILQLNPITFNWKNDSNGPLHYGLVAQEVEKVIPDAVIRSDVVTNDTPDGQLNLKYEELIPILVKSVQELNAKVESLENESARA